MNDLYEVRQISAGYHSKNIIHDISFSVQSHTLCGIVGVNGSGKSTLLKALACQISHTGTSYIDHQCVEDMSVKKLSQHVSYLPQNSGLSISLPVKDVVMMGYNPVLKLFEKPSQKQVLEAISVLKQMGLEDYIEHDYLCLSEGQKQLVLLSRLMIEKTKVLLLDEIDSALDFHNRYEIMKHLKSYINHSRSAAIMCLHDLSLALRFCDQIVLIKDGQCSDIIYPKKDTLETIQIALSKIYSNIKIIQHNQNNEIIYLTYWEDHL